MAKGNMMAGVGLDAEDRADMKKGTYSPSEERKELAGSKGKGHSSPRPTGIPDKRSWNNTTGPSQMGGHVGPTGRVGGKQHNIVNTLAARRMNGISALKGGGAKQR